MARGDQCVRDEAKFVNAVAMTEAITNRLVKLKGQKDCGEDVSETVYPEQLKLQLRMEFKQLTEDQFRAAFDLAINGEKDGVVLPRYIITTPLGLMRSTYGRKTLSCRAREFVREWALTIVALLCVAAYASLKFLTWKRKRDLTKSLVKAIEDNTFYNDGRVQGLSVLDLRDQGMPLRHQDDKTARRTMTLLLKGYPDIQSGEEINRAGEVVYWSAHKLRAEQANYRRQSSRPSLAPDSDGSPRKRKLSQ